MRFGVVLHLLGVVYTFVGLSMLFPLFLSLYYGEDPYPFLTSLAIATVTGLLLFSSFYRREREIGHKDGFLIVTLAWIGVAFFGSLPYIFSGAIDSFIDAYFESISGFTTTGATVLPEIEGLPRGILLWRSLTHWLGGMGIILLSIAILPLLEVGGMQLYKAEAAHITSDRLAPRIIATIRILWLVYVGITVVEFVFLLFAGMNPFDAIVHAFGTVATGGFSNRDMSIESYNSLSIELIILFFMVLSATSFALHYNFLKQGFRAYIRSSEIRFYYSIMFAGVSVVFVDLWLNGGLSPAEALREASFNAVSISSTTGFSSADFAEWPSLSQSVLVLLMIMGGSVGSTAGAIKMLRITILMKVIYRELMHLIHPHAVINIKVNGRPVSQDVLDSVVGFTFLYLTVFVVSSLGMAFLGFDIVTAVSSVAATLGGVGPGLGMVGPLSNYGPLPDAGKIILIIDMLLGRLEIFPVLILLTPEFWRG